MNFITTQGLAMIETNRDSDADSNVVDFQSRAGLHRAFMLPKTEHKTGLPVPLWFGAVNWFNVVTGAAIVVSALAVLAGLVGMVVTSGVLPDMSAIQHALGLAK